MKRSRFDGRGIRYVHLLAEPRRLKTCNTTLWLPRETNDDCSWNRQLRLGCYRTAHTLTSMYTYSLAAVYMGAWQKFIACCPEIIFNVRFCVLPLSALSSNARQRLEGDVEQTRVQSDHLKVAQLTE